MYIFFLWLILDILLSGGLYTSASCNSDLNGAVDTFHMSALSDYKRPKVRHSSWNNPASENNVDSFTQVTYKSIFAIKLCT